MTSRWVTSLTLDLLKGRPMTPFADSTLLSTMVFWKTVRLRNADGDHRRGLKATGHQLEEVQNASRTTTDTLGAAVSRPLPMMVPPTSTSTMFPSSPMPTPHVNPMPAPAAAPMASTVPEPMNLDTIAKLREDFFTSDCTIHGSHDSMSMPTLM